MFKISSLAAASTLALALAGVIAPAFATPILTNRYSFTTNANDSVGGANLTLVGATTVSGGQLQLPGGFHTNYAAATGSSLTSLSNTVNGARAITIEMWLTDAQAGASYSKVFMAGTGRAKFINVTPRKFGAYNSQEFSINGEVDNYAAIMPTNVPYYFAASFDSTANLMTMHGGAVGGALVTKSAPMGGYALSGLGPLAYFTLGYSAFDDPDFKGSIDEMRVWNGAFSAQNAAYNFAAGPSSVPEPSSVLLMGLGLAVFALRRKRKA